jgi:hypothetical protein
VQKPKAKAGRNVDFVDRRFVKEPDAYCDACNCKVLFFHRQQSPDLAAAAAATTITKPSPSSRSPNGSSTATPQLDGTLTCKAEGKPC